MNPSLVAVLLAALLLVPGCGSGGATGTADEQPLGLLPSPPGGSGGATTAPLPARTDRVLVKPRSLLTLPPLLASLGSTLLRPVEGTSWVLVSVPPTSTAAKLVALLDASAFVLDAALDVLLQDPEGAGSTIPAGGLMLGNQIADQQELQRIGGPAARARATGAGVRVAVLDSGVLPDLEGVAGHVEPGGRDFVDDDADPTEQTNGLDDDGDGRTDEGHGHGSFVSSLVIAVAPDVRVLPVRVLDADGVGSASGVASAITYAAQRGVRWVNLSVVVPASVDVVREAIENARLLGVQVLAAAGNTGRRDATLPGATASAFLVAAVGSDDLRAPFSSYGDAVDLSAPGVELHGAYPASPGTARWSGTSFSTALVSGACALLTELHPAWSNDQITARVTATAVPLAVQSPAQPGDLGAGRLDLDAATAP